MTLRTQNFGGVADGADISAANTVNGTDTAVTTVKGTSATAKGTTTAPIRAGGVSAVLTAPSASNVALTWGTTYQSGSIYFEYAWADAAPAVDFLLADIRPASGKAVWVTRTTANKIKVSSGVTGAADLYSVPTALGASGAVGIHLMFDAGTGNTDGRVTFGVYDLSGALALGMTTAYVNSACNTSAGTALSVIRVGKPNTEAVAFTGKVGNMRAQDSYVSALPTTNTPPAVTPGAVQNVTGTTATISFTATDSNGVSAIATPTLASNTMSAAPTLGSPTYSGIGSATATVTYSVTGLSAGTAKWTTTATDNPGATSAASAAAVVNVVSATPGISSVTAATYTVVGGGTAIQALQAGTPSSRYLQSTSPPGGVGGSIVSKPLIPAVPVLFWISAKNSDLTTAETITVYLKESGVIRAQRGPFTVTDAYASYGGTTSSSETAAIVDRSALTVDWIGN